MRRVKPVQPEDNLKKLAELSETKHVSMNGKVTVCGKVVRLGDPVFVKRGDGSQVVKRDCIFGDSSCCVRLVWEGDVDKLVLSNCYRLVNVCVRQWQGNPYVLLSGDAQLVLYMK